MTVDISSVVSEPCTLREWVVGLLLLAVLIICMSGCKHLESFGPVGDSNEVRGTWDAGMEATFKF